MRGLPLAVLASSTMMLVALALSGCFADTERDARQIELLDAAVEEAGLGAIADVVCNAPGGNAGLGGGFNRWILLSGTESWVTVGGKLDDLGYDGAMTEDAFAFARADGILVEGTLIPSPGSSPGVERTLDGLDCTVPEGGGVALLFVEKPAAS